MVKTKLGIEDLLSIQNPNLVKAVVATSRPVLTLPEAQRLTSHLGDLSADMPKIKLGVLHTYTSELLNPWLSLEMAVQGFAVEAFHAPFGVTVQEARLDSGLVTHRPDITLVMLQREDLHPDLAQPLANWNATQRDELRSRVVANLSSLMTRLRAFDIGQIVLSVLPSLPRSGMGLFDTQSERSENAWWNQVKSDVGQMLRESVPSSIYLDLDEVLMELGREHFFDKRLWYASRFPFSPRAAREFSRRIASVGAVLKQPKAKVIVLDADNTMWGGIIGEDGIDGIALGPDYPGSLFVAFQRRILDFQQRGFLLALCSKNNPADLDQVLKEHPHQLLRDVHFAARRVNWLPKPDNLKSLAAELNLGLDSFIFVDDSDHECAAVRQQLPQVEVIQTPARPVEVPECLEHVARLEILTLTAEDSAKTEMYAQERLRRELKDKVDASGVGADDYLASLQMKMLVSIDKASHVPRLSQMTLKTNQFNLTTRRYQEQPVGELVADANWLVADFALADVFGNSGIAGLAMVRRVNAGTAELDTFLMSCRVIGRQAEDAFMQFLLDHLAEQGLTELVADYLPTAKNDMVRSFLSEQGFQLRADGRFVRQLTRPSQLPARRFPIQVTVEI